jgi:hypothetical protein
MAQEYSLKDVCQALRLPRSSYYAWRRRGPSRRAFDNQRLRDKLSELFVSSRHTLRQPAFDGLFATPRHRLQP